MLRPARMARGLLVALAMLSAARVAQAQGDARITIDLPPPTALLREGPTVRGINLLGDSQLRDLVRNGFPARFSFRVELWSASGIFNNLEATTRWDVIVRYEALERTYQVV
ncbi:MAG TPA: hypothetical protein VHM67_03680, partial [Gemmatimonadaceae bacterium]|nr:hypothetical protein [Gemmatimonadaceae bacterium]